MISRLPPVARILARLRQRFRPPPPPSPAPSSQSATNPATGSVFTIDFPYAEVGWPLEYFPAWYYIARPVSRVSLSANGRAVPLHPLHRPDREAPGYGAFSIYLVLADYLDVIDEQGLRFVLEADGEPEVSLQFRVAPYILEPAGQFRPWRAARRQWLNTILRCPDCHQSGLQARDQNLVCDHCQASFPQHQNWDGLNLLNGPLEEATRLAHKTDPVSAHVYDGTLIHKVEALQARGGWALDVGAGLRRQVFPNLVCVEIFDYPSTDVRARGAALPFQDDSFDLVISNAVLEHVPDPFADARELVRVLKPGGELHVMVPFLQPEHGFPYHYYNMTRSGLRQLFDAHIEVDSHRVEGANEPLFSLHWILGIYAAHLPPGERERFLDLPIRELVERIPASYLDDPLITALNPEAKWLIASGHTLVGRKRAS